MPEDKLYCGNCKAELTPLAKACPKCGADPRRAVNFCTLCGEPITNPNAIICTKCGASLKGGRAATGAGGSGGVRLAPGEMDPIIGTVISLFLPFLGLYFFWPEEKRNYAILGLAGAIVADFILFFISAGLILTGIGILCCWIPYIPIALIHLGSAVYTYNEAMKATDGKTLF